MFNISKYLEKFKVIGVSGFAEKEAIIAAVVAETGALLTKKDITIKNGVAYIHAHSLIKNQIQVKKTKILSGVEGVTDIR